MKKFRFFLGALAVLGFVTFFSSCNPDTLVTLNFKDNIETVNAEPGEVVTIVYTLTPDAINNGELGQLVVKDDDLNEVANEQYSGTSTLTDSIDFTVPTDAVEGDQINLTFTATDGTSGLTSTKTFQINVVINLPAIITGTGTVNYNSQSDTTEFGWQLVADAKGVTVTQVNSDDADLVFFFNDTYRQQILSPDAEQIMNQEAYSNWDYTLTGKKTTKIQEATEADFTGASDETVNALTVTSDVHPGGGNGVDHVMANEYYKFELSDGRKGVFKVTASNPPYTKAPIIESNITLEFKWQEEPASAAK